MKTLKVGICGLGTVGGGVLSLLRRGGAEPARRLGMPVKVVHVASRSLNGEPVASMPQSKARPLVGAAKLSTDPFAVVDDPQVDVVVETLGGFDPARQLVARALEAGKHVVTANKALLAEHGNELFELARQKNLQLAYEAAVGGGIPLIKVLREGLAANRIDYIAGIINGTGNYILSAMAAGHRPFAEVLKEAQDRGYAEADPAFDIEGTDAAHKLTIMAAIAFGIPLRFNEVYIEGISRITPEDIAYAGELGYRIKHLGIARRSAAGGAAGGDAEGLSMRVHPALVPASALLAQIDGIGNGVLVGASPLGPTLYNGPGAGGDATASAVVADLVDIGRDVMSGATRPRLPPLGRYEVDESLPQAERDASLPSLGIEDIETEYYLRIPVQDKLGVMARISSVLEAHAISIEAVIQKEALSDTVPIVLLTHRVPEHRLNDALTALQSLPEVQGNITRIRVENLGSE